MPLSFWSRVAVAVVLAAATALAMCWIQRVYPHRVFAYETTFSKDLITTAPALPSLGRSISLVFSFTRSSPPLLFFLCLGGGRRHFASAALIAGALDAFVENPIMLLEIDGASTDVLTFLKALGSWIKWLLLLAIVFYL